MAPKKAAAVTNTSLSKDPENKDESKTGVPEESRKPTAVRKAATHPPTMEMVKEALKELDSRKGVSAQAIRGFIKQKYKTVDENRVKLMVRKALVKGIESGAFVRPATSSTTTGAQGRFRLAVRKNPKEAKQTKKAKKEAKENANPNVDEAKNPDAEEAGSEKAKPVRKVKSAVEKPKKGGTSKVAPAKKPKTKRLAGSGEAEPRPKALKSPESEGGGSGKAVPKKVKGGAAEVEGRRKGAGVAKRGGKKEAPKPAGEKASPKAGAVPKLSTAPPKASTRKGKKAV